MITEKLRVLVLEDMADDVALIERELRASGLAFTLQSVATEDAYQAALRDNPPDVILADYMLPSYDGLTAMKIAQERLRDAPFLIVSGTLGEDFAKECLKRGAAAYVPKKSLSLLGPAVARAVEAARARTDGRDRGERSEAWKDPARKGTGRTTVLIIDDDAGLRKTLSDILKAKGFAVLSAKDGREGIELVKQEDVHVALVDLRLPDMTGLTVIESIREASPPTQAIILTGNATLDTAIEATSKGAFSYMQKPYDIEQLLVHIRRAVEKRASAEKILGQNTELQRMNSELKALFDVSLSISRTLDLEKLFPEILQTLEEMEIFRVERKGAIFLVEEGGMRLACHNGFSQAMIESCGNLRPGECLCGLAAEKGELVISDHSSKDARHTVVYDGMSPHGHIIVPLKAAGVVTGVLCLYTAQEPDIDIKVFHMLSLIGNELGIAISNARLYESARSSALHDPLTGLANRRLLGAMLSKSIARSVRSKTRLAAVMIDIDYFKKYNDTRGHVQGDRLLKELGGILASRTRKSDLVCRYGGEEFLVLLHETGIEGARVVAEELRQTVEAELGVTISLGVAEYSEALMKEEEELIARADEALYRAKAMGRNRTEVTLHADAGGGTRQDGT